MTSVLVWALAVETLVRGMVPATVSRLLPFTAAHGLLGTRSAADTPETLAAALSNVGNAAVIGWLGRRHRGDRHRPADPAGFVMERFAAFRHGNFRRYFAGQVISSVGTWLQALAVTWLVLDLTGRSDRLGIAVALQFLPLLLLGAPAGVLADRVDNRRLLMTTSAVSAVLALVFGLVVSAGTRNLWVIYGLTFLSGSGAGRRAPGDAGTAVPARRT